MKIKYMSDLHIEFGGMKMPNPDDCDVLVLAGDIHVGANATSDILIDWADHFKHVIFVHGNHELYHQDIWDFKEDMKGICDEYHNIHNLDNNVVEIDDVVFIGSVLWSDIVSAAFYQMNDSRLIKDSTENSNPYQYGKGTMTESTVKAMHKIAVDFLKEKVEENLGKKIVVVTHHAPSYQSIGTRYLGHLLMNTGYATEILHEFKNKVALWIHGHTHHCVDYKKDGIKVVANTRGYVGYEESPGFDPNKVVEV